MKIRNYLLCAAIALSVAAPAAAQITQLTSTGQITTSYVNDFETARDTGPVTFTSGVLQLASGYSTGVTTSGIRGLASSTYPGSLTANLSAFYTAVGLNFGNDDTCCSEGFSAVLSVFSGATNLGSVSVTANMNDFVDQFIGLSSAIPFDRVSITYGANTGLYTYIDDFRLGTPSNGAVPEPSTWAMMLLGFGGIGVALRRRRARTNIAKFA